MLFGKKKNHYSASFDIMAEKGYCDEYITALRGELETASGKRETADGMCRLANGLLFTGRLAEAVPVFEQTDIRSVPREQRQPLAANYILCLFLLNRFKDADRVYEEYNEYALAEPDIMLKRTVGIHEFTSGRFDSAITVFIKMLDGLSDERGTVMADICAVRALLKLDMTDDALALSENFTRYDGRHELETICRKLRKKIFDKVSSDNKVKMVKGKKKKK